MAKVANAAALPGTNKKKRKTAAQRRATALVASHSVTTRLKALGITDAQLDASTFANRREPGGFDGWAYRPAFVEPLEALMLAKAYCALKWLVIDNPPDSPDRDAGWRLVAEAEVAPLVASARRAQDQHAKNTARGVAARTKYGAEDHAKWRAMAAKKDPKHSKRRKAELIAAELKLPEAAVETIRRKI